MTDVWEGRKRDNLYQNEWEGSSVARATNGTFKLKKKMIEMGVGGEGKPCCGGSSGCEGVGRGRGGGRD